uniref:Uncharacterized protein n=1 Tax=Bionectria ochroleuca TaxID=29856 RepID=A0A8H7NFR8_BIOOC
MLAKVGEIRFVTRGDLDGQARPAHYAPSMGPVQSRGCVRNSTRPKPSAHRPGKLVGSQAYPGRSASKPSRIPTSARYICLIHDTAGPYLLPDPHRLGLFFC